MLNELAQFGPWGLLLARLALAAVMLVIGMPKLKPDTFQANVKEFRETFGLRAAPLWATINVLVEVPGAILLVLGLWAEIVSLLIAVQMVAGIVIKIFKLRAGFRSGWSYDLLTLAVALVVATHGPGALASWPLVQTS